MTSLGRVNLLVGTNNCGKTSVLEAIHNLSSFGRPDVLWDSTNRRGERDFREDIGNRASILDARHLFYNHEFSPELTLKISGRNDTSLSSFTVRVVEREREGQQLLLSRETGQAFEEFDTQIPMDLELEWEAKEILKYRVPLVNDTLGNVLRLSRIRENTNSARHTIETPIRFITTDALNKNQVILDFENVVLGPEEQQVIEALCIIKTF